MFRRSTFITSPAALAAALGVTGECLWLTGVRALATTHQVTTSFSPFLLAPKHAQDVEHGHRMQPLLALRATCNQQKKEATRPFLLGVSHSS